jgi:hypothetical protein
MEGKEGYISVVPWRKMKTNEQNRYYRGVVVKRFADEWGCSNEDAHQALSREHLSYKIGLPSMPKLVKSSSNTEWSTAEW